MHASASSAVYCVFKDSDSEEEEPSFYMASELSGKIQAAAQPSHNLSLLSLTVNIDKGRLLARTDEKVGLFLTSNVSIC